MNIIGIHHVTAMTQDAADNVQFYTEVLGMRLIKKTVNQDDTTAYHLFYGDEVGNPGTELTFFDFPDAPPVQKGVGSISTTSLRVKNDRALDYWADRLTKFGVNYEPITQFGGRQVLFFEDPEGQRLALISDENNTGVKAGIPWDRSPVPTDYGITGLGPVKLTVRRPESTMAVLKFLGFSVKERIAPLVSGQEDLIVMEVGEGGTGAEIWIETRTDLPMERQGYGGVHHVAFRVKDEHELRQWIARINETGLPNSGFVERYYFRSLYFREANGILFELATDGPGFTTDEPIESLGESLALPPFLESRRAEIEANIKPLNTKRR
ncbi:ring-cleaving dioxygenase [Sporosarcina cyprini]|uniref:ring-cleaving dioxygenase n=1 Tax=Sporosarcina cyprini TaxID=2910523 RepID=UPI001EE0EE0A|nr:ring-cleaving dioxygenase [Sporosarcina cyprini]MCG3089509.1 ring-cleaving dioxygenase [Sporosarcina cyprini]